MKRFKAINGSVFLMRFFVRRFVISVITALYFFISPAMAEKKQETTIETITVTAQKQEENIQDVPVGITALTAQEIEDKKIESVENLADFVPNFMVFCNGGPGMNSPSMRGITAPIETLAVSAGLFIDGVPVLSNMGFEDTFLDIERIEVLRGPQGTLYGKNTETGAVNIITRQPDNEFRARLSTSIGTLLSSEADDSLTQTYTLNLSSPIQKDKLYMGFAGKFHKKDGFIENTLTGEPYDDRQNWYGRVHARWTPTDQWDLSFVASQIEYDGGGVIANLSEDATASFGLSAPEYRKVSADFEGQNNTACQSQSLKINYNISESLELTSITARRVYDDKLANDWDFSPVTLSHTDKDSQYSKLSQELRLNYKHGGVKWIAGIYADKDEVNFDTQSFSASTTSVTDRDIDGHSYAVFTNVTYPLGQRFSLTGGLRYETEEMDFEDHISGKATDDSWEGITPKLALEYRISQAVMTYVSASKGYRSGGFNALATDSEYYSFDEEELWSYEIGAKTMCFNNRLMVNGSIFMMDISDMQVSETITLTETYITNAAQATGKGIELELTAKITPALSVMAGFGYIDIEFDDFKDNAGSYEGNQNPFSPEYSFNIGAQYRFENGWYARADLICYGEMYLDKANEYKRDAYQIVNAKIGYETDHFDIYLYGKNIFDQEYDSIGYFGYYTVYSNPGEVGLQLNYRF
ncbi:TonB-dependent receptor domain-containing protein [uncultured Desulfobacter sp.]|uniref:TonB-dependent receptor n=1 Tax=uncultured Desulfobacter sp. TaxID=240139 RepID=UPI0029F4C454|nr:TonB-dependent receptor [uncultured Desulfobacter sp.]